MKKNVQLAGKSLLTLFLLIFLLVAGSSLMWFFLTGSAYQSDTQYIEIAKENPAVNQFFEIYPKNSYLIERGQLIRVRFFSIPLEVVNSEEHEFPFEIGVTIDPKENQVKNSYLNCYEIEKSITDESEIIQYIKERKCE